MADRIPVILSKDRSNQADRTRLENQLIEKLSQRPEVELTVLPHLYDLPVDGPGMRLVQSVPGDLIVLAWLYPRSAFWVLDANRVRGRLGPTSSLPEEKPERIGARVDGADVPKRTLWCFDLRAHDRPKPYLEEIGRIVEAAPVIGPSAEATPRPAAGPNEIEESPRSRWYPVIDYNRCTNCLECLNFCLFGVYDLDESEAIVADQPDACRAGCPACARICPAGAIMFPEHKDPAIAGDPKASPEGFKLDLSQLFGGADPAQMAVAERNRALAARGDEAGPPQADPEPQQAKNALDRLVDQVDELDL